MLEKIKIQYLVATLLIVSSIATADLLSSAKNLMGDDALVGGLASSLGISPEQAGGSLGSILSLAQNKLPAIDYASLTAVIPGADSYIKMAKDAGVLTDPITDVGRLNSAMDKLGISPETTSSLYSKLGDFVGSAGGDSMKDSLLAILE
jgi:hypothetical protein